MSISRRGVLAVAAGSWASLALGLAPTRLLPLLGGNPALAAPARSISLADLTRKTFEPLVGSAFTFRPPSADSVDVVLWSVEDRPLRRQDPKGLKGEAFSLLFSGPPERDRPVQGIYSVEHPSLGSLELFVVPVGPGRVIQDYEVIVNHRTISTNTTKG